MKKLNFLSILIFTIIFFACENSNNKQISTDVVKNTKSAVEHAEKGTPSIITFEETEHFFGDVIQGEKVTYSFKFHTNFCFDYFTKFYKDSQIPYVKDFYIG